MEFSDEEPCINSRNKFIIISIIIIIIIIIIN